MGCWTDRLVVAGQIAQATSEAGVAAWGRAAPAQQTRKQAMEMRQGAATSRQRLVQKSSGHAARTAGCLHGALLGYTQLGSARLIDAACSSGLALALAERSGYSSEPQVPQGAEGGAVAVHRLKGQQRPKGDHRGAAQPELRKKGQRRCRVVTAEFAGAT